MSTEDYSNFSWESIEKSLRDIFAEVKAETGATDEELKAAFFVCATKIMNTNMLREPRPDGCICSEAYGVGPEQCGKHAPIRAEFGFGEENE